MTNLKVPVTETDHIQGFFQAPVTVVEYGDYQCSFCALVHPVLKQLEKALKLKIRFVFRNFPLKEAHPYAMMAAEAAEAAGWQSKFWEMHDRIYEQQHVLSPEAIEKFAEQLQLDLQRFSNDRQSLRVKNKIEEDFRGGLQSGVNGMPCFFINGERYDGGLVFDSLLQAIEQAQEALNQN